MRIKAQAWVETMQSYRAKDTTKLPRAHCMQGNACCSSPPLHGLVHGQGGSPLIQLCPFGVACSPGNTSRGHSLPKGEYRPCALLQNGAPAQGSAKTGPLLNRTLPTREGTLTGLSHFPLLLNDCRICKCLHNQWPYLLHRMAFGAT